MCIRRAEAVYFIINSLLNLILLQVFLVAAKRSFIFLFAPLVLTSNPCG